MRLYFDTAYVAKCYLNEPGGVKVRKLAVEATGLYSSSWSVAELACALHRQIRDRLISEEEAARQRRYFLKDVRNGVWVLLPVSDRLLFELEARVGSLPASLFLRAGDAIHLVTAQGAGFSEIWTNDRHLLAAAPFFGLTGRSV